MRISCRFPLHHLLRSHFIEVILCLQVRFSYKKKKLFPTKQSLFLQTFYYCLGGSIGQYIYDYYLRSYTPITDTLSKITTTTTIGSEFGQCKDQLTSAPAQQWAQQQSSNLFFYQTVAASIPTIIMTYILGLYTHQLGRKFVLILTMFGNVFQYAIWLFIIYYQVSLGIKL